MDLRSYLAALRKSWLLIVLFTVAGVAIGAAGFFRTPPTYASTVDFYVSTPQTAGTSAQSGGQFAESRVNSYILLLSSEQLGQRVADSTGVQLTPLQLAQKVSATAELNTVIVTATITDALPQRSLQIAQGVADDFPKLVDELDNQGRPNAIVDINVVSGPTLLPSPVSPDWKRYIGLGLAAGLLLGLIVAVLRELLDTSVRHVDVAQRLVGAPVLGTIGFDPDTKKSPLIIGPESASIRAESYRQLRTNLQFISATRSADVILVTSSLPLEGKSTTAVNLALTFVEFGERVLLIEGDLRRPKMAEYLELEREVGLSNVLAGQVQFDEVVQTWGDGGLFFLGSGSTPPNPSELLGSAQMAALIESLKTRYDKIVIDSPPVLPVTDAVVASVLAEAVVLVIRHGRTSRAQVSAATRALAGVDARVVGSVLNMKRQSRAERHTYGTDTYYGAASAASLPAPAQRATPGSNDAEGAGPDGQATSGDGQGTTSEAPGPTSDGHGSSGDRESTSS
ncbi:MAG: polysaccharide biosynthesis tyrosine autokinase [Propionibacteriaceae bacterium]